MLEQVRKLIFFTNVQWDIISIAVADSSRLVPYEDSKTYSNRLTEASPTSWLHLGEKSVSQQEHIARSGGAAPGYGHDHEYPPQQVQERSKLLHLMADASSFVPGGEVLSDIDEHISEISARLGGRLKLEEDVKTEMDKKSKFEVGNGKGREEGWQKDAVSKSAQKVQKRMMTLSDSSNHQWTTFRALNAVRVFRMSARGRNMNLGCTTTRER